MMCNQILEELKNKERTLSDIARYVGNIPDNNPNYCLLLGSGCSVTSDIKSGGQLVEEWRENIFNTFYPSDKYDHISAKNKLSTEQGAWYDPRNEYSSLFEKKYDLPRQRRMFVESEVSDKSPSIGYAYLVKLIESCYFNTIFTTNFDDLLNEAFYRFSDKRPITCAHDSSINSITVTSKRPKIIKLHGDFLFDDIKSTLRETESLENNMKNKFIEFSKDYGLIVVGYGGYDRSVLDVLTFLLKNEEYFKNGIYWCLRENDEIGTELHKLLWKERVYYVKIDGFDELFAELNHTIQNNKLPLDSNITTSKSKHILDEIEDKISINNTNSQIIFDDIKTIKSNLREEQIKVLLKSKRNDDSSNDEFTDSSLEVEKQMLWMRLDSYLDNGDFNSFNKDILSFEELSREGASSVSDFILLKAKYYSIKGDIKKARDYYEIVFDKHGGKPKYLCKAAMLEYDDEALSLLEKAIKRDPFYGVSYSLKAEVLQEEYDKSYIKDKDIYHEICSLFQKSLTLDPARSNHAWLNYFNFMFDNINDSKLSPECESLRSELEKQSCNDITLVQMNLREIKLNSGKDDSTQVSNKYIEDLIKESYGRNKFELKQYHLIWMISTKYIIDFEELLDKFKDKYRVQDDIVVAEADYWGECFGNYSKSIEILEKRLKNKFSKQILYNLFSYYKLSGEYKKAEDILNQYFPKNRKLRYLLLSFQNKWSQIKEITTNFDIKNKDDVIERSFALMKLKEYEAAKKILRESLSINKWNDELLIINHEICDYFIKKGKVNKERLTKLLKTSNSDIILIGANTLLGKVAEAKKLLREMIDKDYPAKLYAKSWVLWEIKHLEELKEIIFDES